MSSIKRGQAVMLTGPRSVEPQSDGDSYIIDGNIFVKQNVAIMPNGVALKDASKTFVVEPETITLGEILGRGASSYVQKGVHIPTSTPLALKVINVFDKSKRAQLIKEIQTLYDADCDTLVSFYGAFYKDGAITIALEYMDVGSLSTLLASIPRSPSAVATSSPRAFPEPVLASIMFQCLWALAYLRVEKRIHRDLKPSNILVNSKGQVKVSDFGISAELQHSLGMAATFTGTCRYMSPERITHQAYSFPSDIWSLGIILIECATGEFPYGGCSAHIELAEAIVGGPEPTLPASAAVTPELREFAASCLRKNAAERLPADILLGSPWFVRHGIVSNDIAAETMRSWLAGVPTEGVVPSPVPSPRPGHRHVRSRSDPFRDASVMAAARAALLEADDSTVSTPPGGGRIHADII